MSDALLRLKVKDIIMYTDIRRSILNGKTLIQASRDYLEEYKDTRHEETIRTAYGRIQKNIIEHGRKETS